MPVQKNWTVYTDRSAVHLLLSTLAGIGMAHDVAEQKGSADSFRNPTAWADELWGNNQTASLYGSTLGSFGFDNQWQKYIGGNSANLEIIEPNKTEKVEAPTPPEFTNRLYDAWQKAVEQGKPLIVEFSQESCGWCKKLNEETFKSPELAAMKDKAVWVRLDPMKDEDDKGNVAQLQKDLGVDRFPTTVILDVTATTVSERGRIIGFFGPKDFAGNLNQILTPNDQQPVPQQAVA